MHYMGKLYLLEIKYNLFGFLNLYLKKLKLSR